MSLAAGLRTGLKTAIGRKGVGLLTASALERRRDRVWVPDESGELTSALNVRRMAAGAGFITFEGMDGAIGDQGATSSCVGEMLAGLMTICELLAGLPFDPPSPRAIYRQSVLEHTRPGAEPLDLGTYLRTALSAVRAKGTPSLASWPRSSFKVLAPVPAGIRAQGDARSGLVYEFLRAASDDELLDIVDAALALNQPVGYGGPVTERYQRHRGAEPFDARFIKSDKIVGGHARVQVSQRRADGAYRERNSWGRGWGDGGYAWILADTVERQDVCVVSGWQRLATARGER